MTGKVWTRRGALALLAGGAAAALGGWYFFPYRSHTYRFRMTVEVQTPQGATQGSSVYEVRARKLAALTSEAAERSLGTLGEATIIDLPSGPVFVLMKTPDEAPDVAFGKMSMAALDPEFKNDWVESAGRIGRSWSTLRGDVRREDWPLIVRFRDITDPRSVEAVDPEVIGVKRIAVETTDDDVTTGIEKRLRWLRTHNGALVYDGRMHPDAPEKDLNQRVFSTEIGK